MDSDLPNVLPVQPGDEASKAGLLRCLPVVILERAWVTISPDGSAEPDFMPRDPLVKAELNYDLCNARPEIVLSVTVPAIVYCNGTVSICKTPSEFFRKDVIGGWSDLIVGL